MWPGKDSVSPDGCRVSYASRLCVSCRRGAGQGRQSRVGIAARAQSWAAGQADAMAILMRRRSLICFASGVHTTLLGSCLAACARAPGRSEGAFQARVHVQPATRLPACSHVDVSGISQVSRRSILCLCLGPRPRPNRRSLAYLTVSSMLPPLRRQRRLQRHGYIGAIAGLQHLLPTLQEWCCHHPCKARFRPAGSPLPGGS